MGATKKKSNYVKPGKFLAELERLRRNFRKIAEDLSAYECPNVEETHGKMQQFVQDLGDKLLQNPDYIQVVMMLEFDRDSAQLVADREQLRTDVISDAVSRIRNRLREHLTTLDGQKVTGKSVELSLIESEPRIVIEKEIMKEAGPEYKKTVEVLDEAKIIAAVRAGMAVDGVKLEPMYAIDMRVLKKGEKDGSSSESKVS